MKLHHFASAATAVLLVSAAAPAFAQGGAGYVDASIGEIRDEGTGNSASTWGASGAYAFNFGEGMNFQIEGAYADQQGAGSLDAFAVGGSLFNRMGMYGFGGTALYLDFDVIDGWEGSGFAQVYTDGFTGTARAFYGSLDANGPSIEYRGATLDGQFYLGDNAAVNLNVSYTDFENLDGGFGAGLGAEWAPANWPVGIFGGGNFNDDVSFFQVGLRATLGAETIRERSQQGVASPIAASRLTFGF